MPLHRFSQFYPSECVTGETLEKIKIAWLISVCKMIFTVRLLGLIGIALLVIIMFLTASLIKPSRDRTNLLWSASIMIIAGFLIQILLMLSFRRESLVFIKIYIGLQIVTNILLIIMMNLFFPLLGFIPNVHFWPDIILVIIYVWDSVIFGVLAWKFHQLIKRRNEIQQASNQSQSVNIQF